MITFIIQARLGSTRLPNKILLPFYKEQSIISLIIERLKQFSNTEIILATSNLKRDEPLISLAKKEKIKCFYGSETDVLKRFIDAAECNNSKQLIRVCSDNPFLDFWSIKSLIKNAEGEDVDYMSFTVNGKPSIKTHFGFWTEYVTLSALKKVQSLTSESLYHEHVTNYIYTNPDIFKIKFIETAKCLDNRNDIRLTIDTAIDFENAKKIYADLYSTNSYPTIDDVVKYLDIHSDYLAKMKNEILKNNK